MKGPTILLFGALLLGSALVACGNQEVAETSGPAAGPAARPPSAGRGDWPLPVYPGSSEDEEYYITGDASKFLNGKPAVLESRMYTTSDKVDTVVAFFKQKMPASGWKDTGWIEAEPMSLGQYEKDGGNDTAVVQVYVESNATNIKIDRIYAK